jgi:hypothetical protein
VVISVPFAWGSGVEQFAHAVQGDGIDVGADGLGVAVISRLRGVVKATL